MSFCRWFIWTCNYCGRSAGARGYGLPTGWGYTVEMFQPLKHICIEGRASFIGDVKNGLNYVESVTISAECKWSEAEKENSL